MRVALRFFILMVFTLPVTSKGFSEQQEPDTLFAPVAEPIPLIYLADTLCVNQPDNAPLFFERLPKNNSETVFGKPHLLEVTVFLEAPLKKRDSGDWFFFVIAVSLVLSSLSFLYFPYYSRQFFRSVVDAILLKRIKKEEYFENRTPKWMLSANFLIVVALLVALSTPHSSLFGFDFDLASSKRFGLALGLVSALFFTKRGLEWFVSWVFGQERVLEIHQETTVFFNNLTGLALLPLVMGYYYNPHIVSLDLLWILLALAFLIKIFRRSLVWLRNSNLPLFHIFLYLCAVELAPLLLVYKLATSILKV